MKVGFTITAVYTLQLLWLNGEQYILPCLINTIIGLFNCFGGTVWLWSQWYNGLLRKNAHDASEAYQKVILAQQHFTSGGTVAGRLLPIRYAALMREFIIGERFCQINHLPVVQNRRVAGFPNRLLRNEINSRKSRA
ncbi:inner membrane protein [Escherichia coli]|uniref:Inner membrane protein n=3 Tax=Escherichia coli TaxID=562 RepID=A0A2X1L4U2_ECOLX|nr:inner membrane protein [Escherichia coli]